MRPSQYCIFLIGFSPDNKWWFSIFYSGYLSKCPKSKIAYKLNKCNHFICHYYCHFLCFFTYFYLSGDDVLEKVWWSSLFINLRHVAFTVLFLAFIFESEQCCLWVPKLPSSWVSLSFDSLLLSTFLKGSSLAGLPLHTKDVVIPYLVQNFLLALLVYPVI